MKQMLAVIKQIILTNTNVSLYSCNLLFTKQYGNRFEER